MSGKRQEVREARQELRTIKVLTSLDEQMQDLGKSINVYNNNPNVKNPFVQNDNPQPSSSGSPAPSTETPAPPSNSSTNE